MGLNIPLDTAGIASTVLEGILYGKWHRNTSVERQT